MATISELRATFRMQIDQAMKDTDRMIVKLKELKRTSEMPTAITALEQQRQSYAGMITTLDKMSNATRRTGNEFKFLGSMTENFMLKGMLMGIGWQAINQILDGVKSTIKGLFTANIEWEASLVSLQLVARNTGRSFADIYNVIVSNIDSFADRTSIATGVLKLLGTSLSTKEINEFIRVVKEGSAAMGEDFNEQIKIVAKGFKLLNPNILDNIGVNVRLDRMTRQVARTMGISVTAVTQNMVQHELLNEMIRQTEAYTGAWEARMKTTQGSIARLDTETRKFMQTISDSGPIKAMADAFSEAFKTMREGMEIEKLKNDIPAVAEAFKELEASAPKPFLIGGGDWKTHWKSVLEFKDAALDVGAATEMVKIRIVELMAAQQEYSKDSEQYGKIQEKINYILDDFSELVGDTLPNLSEADFRIQLLASVQKQFDDEMKKTILDIDVFEKKMEEYGISIEDLKKAYTLYTTVMKEINDEIKRNGELLLEQEQLQESLENQIKDTTREIQDENVVIRELQYKLSDARDELKEFTNQQKDAQSAVDETKRAIEDIEKVLFPERFETTIDKYETTQRNLTRALQEQERAREQLLKRVEPMIYQKHLEEEAEITSEVNKLTDDETRLKGELGDELILLNNRLANEVTALDKANDKLAESQRKVDDLTGSIESSRKKIDDWNDELLEVRRNLEDNVIPAIKEYSDAAKNLGEIQEYINTTPLLWGKIIDLEGLKNVADTANPIINDLYNNIQRLVNIQTTAGIEVETPTMAIETYLSGDYIRNYKKKIADEYRRNPNNLSEDMKIKARQYMAEGYEVGKSFVPETGLYQLHKGEIVYNTFQTRQTTTNSMMFGGGSIVIQAGNRDIEEIFDEISRISRRRLARRVN